MSTPTLRSLARELGVSRTTISEALRGSPRVHPETAARIRAAAKEAGYEHNPLAGAIMSELRRSRGDIFRGVLGLIGIDEADRPGYAIRFHDALKKGAVARAAELGFKIESFTAGDRSIPLRRLDGILQSRGIRGLLILPTWSSPDFTRLSWENYTGAYLDYHIEKPAIRCVCSDHFRSMIESLQKLHDLGYRRPGVILPRQQDMRLHHRWEGAFMAFQNNHADVEPVKPLVADAIDQETFSKWFNEYKPDVVLGHITEAVEWMKACGASIPRTHGFFCLNLAHATVPCAGLDLAPDLIGARAAEIVIAQLHRNECGIPKSHSLTTLKSTWVDGPTLRKQKTATTAKTKRKTAKQV